MGISSEVSLSGQLICASLDESERVRDALDLHISLTRAEVGCLSFEVTATANPLIWFVSERFLDAAAFSEHQTRAAASEWATATQGIKRDYVILGLE